MNRLYVDFAVRGVFFLLPLCGDYLHRTKADCLPVCSKSSKEKKKIVTKILRGVLSLSPVKR